MAGLYCSYECLQNSFHCTLLHILLAAGPVDVNAAKFAAYDAVAEYGEGNATVLRDCCGFQGSSCRKGLYTTTRQAWTAL